MKIYLDDERNAPDDSWLVVRDPVVFLWSIQNPDTEAIITEISLDHDLGLNVNMTGYDVLSKIEEFYDGFHPPFTIRIHTHNPSGHERMGLVIRAMRKRNMNAGMDYRHIVVPPFKLPFS